MLGDQWHRMLVSMEKDIAEAGMTPIVEVSNEATRHMLILAIDDLMPSWLKATPAIVATFKTTALTTQRFAKAKAIKEAQSAQKRAVHVVTRPAQVEAPPSQPQPAPTPIRPDIDHTVDRRREEEEANRGPRINRSGKIIPADHVIR